MEFQYSLEDAEGNTILSKKSTLDEVVKYLDDNTTTATQYKLVIASNNSKKKFQYTRTEELPNLNDTSVRRAFNLNPVKTNPKVVTKMSDEETTTVNLSDYMIQDEIAYDSSGAKIPQKIYIDKKGERFILKTDSVLVSAPRVSYHNGQAAPFWPGAPPGNAYGEQLHNTETPVYSRLEDVPGLLNSICPTCGYRRISFPHTCPPKAPNVGFGKL